MEAFILPGPRDETGKAYQEFFMENQIYHSVTIFEGVGGLSGPLKDQARKGDTPLVLGGERTNLQVLLLFGGS